MEMVDLHRQEPNRNRRESKYFWDGLFPCISAAGFKGIELPYEPKWDFGRRSGIPLTRRSLEIKFGNIKGFLKSLESKGIEKITGVHFDPTLFAGDNQEMYFGAYQHFAQEALSFAIEAGCDTLTLTPTPPIGSVAGMCKDERSFLDRTAELISGLAGQAEGTSVRVCIKNEYWSMLRGENIRSFMEKLPTSVCYNIDTANIAIAGVKPDAFIKACAGRIGSVTLTDTAFIDSREYYKRPLPEFPQGKAEQVFRDLGQGDVDFQAVLDALTATGYDNWLIVNNRQTRDIYRGLLRARYYIDNILKGGES
jgi:sugar phosphate isomerase/epimerase